MIVRIRNVGLAVGGAVDNIVAGKSIEFSPDDSRLSIASSACITPAGNPIEGVRLTARLTDEVFIDDADVPAVLRAATILPDHLLSRDQAVARGDHLIVRVSNTSASIVDVVTVIEVTPL